jgi:hypothetical protein
MSQLTNTVVSAHKYSAVDSQNTTFRSTENTTGIIALRKHYTLNAFHITLNTKIITTLLAPSMRTTTQYVGLDLLNEDAMVTCLLFCHQKYFLNNAGPS